MTLHAQITLRYLMVFNDSSRLLTFHNDTLLVKDWA